MFEAATLAPSCANNQPWRFLVCRTADALERARDALSGGNYWAKKAPVLVVVLTSDEYDRRRTDDRRYAQFDTGMATMALMMQATREGLYAHTMAGFEPLKLRENFGIGAEMRVVTMIAIGYPGSSDHLSEKHKEQELSERTRLPLSRVVSHDTWSPGDSPS